MILSPSSVFYPAPAGAQMTYSPSVYIEKTASIGSMSQFIFSCWFKGTQTNAQTDLLTIYKSGSGTGITTLTINAVSSSQFKFLSTKPGSSPVARSYYSSPVSTFSIGNGKWHHVIISWDSTVPALKIYVDDVVYNIGSIITDSGGTSDAPDTIRIGQVSAGISEVFLQTNTTLDISITSNRRKFVSSTNRPVFLGSNGSLPLGVQPIVYLQGIGTGFNVNSGSLGNFTTTGTLTTPTTTPSAP
jgi:hypothetical protein